jgi:hypothetical protein
MCVHTAESGETDAYLDHAENIDIDLLLALDPDNMEIGKAFPIGDRNWGDRMNLESYVDPDSKRKTYQHFRFSALKLEVLAPHIRSGFRWQITYPGRL